ncbi:hypothetical protein CVV38_03070 [Candidatus Peregrinibacteria bacterium HGW-Peregrinibacteria-1]|jgi:anti-anti-sigma factor|nr:MAG: hypothetical protein CVV38_03070 [Candidatus Peregrinibacteria bacterium HGW-Peregrinibacteria-1]
MTEALILIENISNNLKVIQIDGQLDESNVDEKITTIYQDLETSQPGTNYILDFTNLNYINSKTIGYLTDIYGKITQNGGKIVIAGAKPNITDILQVVGLTQLLETYATFEDAKTAMSVLTSTAGTTPTATPATPEPSPQQASPVASPEPTVPTPPPEAPQAVELATPPLETTVEPKPEAQPAPTPATPPTFPAPQPEVQPPVTPPTPQPTPTPENTPQEAEGEFDIPEINFASPEDTTTQQ